MKLQGAPVFAVELTGDKKDVEQRVGALGLKRIEAMGGQEGQVGKIDTAWRQQYIFTTLKAAKEFQEGMIFIQKPSGPSADNEWDVVEHPAAPEVAKLRAQVSVAPQPWTSVRTGAAQKTMQEELSSDMQTRTARGGLWEPQLQGVTVNLPQSIPVNQKQQVLAAQLASDQIGMRKYTKEMPDRLKEEMQNKGYQVTVAETSTLEIKGEVASLTDRRTLTFSKGQKSFSTTCTTYCSCVAKLASTGGGVSIQKMQLTPKPPVLQPMVASVTVEKAFLEDYAAALNAATTDR